jgi:ATP-binding cassette subfamily B protein
MDNCRKVFPNTLRLFVTHFFKPYKIYFVLFFFIDIFTDFYVPIQSYIIKKLVDAATPMLGKAALIDVTLFPSGCLIIFTILNLLSWRVNNYLNLKSLPSLKANIIDEGSNYTRYHSFGFFQNHLSGAVSNRIIDLANNAEFLISNFRGLLRNLLVIVGAIAMSLVINLFFSLIFFMASVLIILASLHISKKIDPFAREFSNSRSIAFGTLMDSFVNIINVILFAREQHEKTHLSGYLNNMASTDQLLQKKLMQYGFGMSGLSILVQTLIIGSLIYLGARGFLTAGDFVLIFMLTFIVLDHVCHFIDNLLIL